MSLEWADNRRDRQWLALLAGAREAHDRFPDREGAVCALIEAQLECGYWSAARQTLDVARQRFAGAPALALLEARVDGLESSRRAPDNLEQAAAIARRSGDWQRVLDLCEREPANVPMASIIFHRALALARLGRETGESIGIDPTADSECTMVSPPGPWETLAAFNRALSAELAGIPVLDSAQHQVATRSGRQTETLIAVPGGPIEQLFGCLRAAADAFVERRPWLSLPVGAGPLAITAWSVSYPAAGHQVSHLHPDGWLSAVYCVARPSGSRARLNLGSLSGGLDGDLTPPWAVRAVDLQPGELVIFPSWIPHAGTPHECCGERVVIAIDMIPQQPGFDAAVG